MEAADDICFRIVDIEDGFKLGLIEFDRAKEVLEAIGRHSPGWRPSGIRRDPDQEISYLRAKAINILIDEVASVFLKHEASIRTGSFKGTLLDQTNYRDEIEHAKKLAIGEVFESEHVTKTEIAGFRVISGLLDIFAETIQNSGRPDELERRIDRLLHRKISQAPTLYAATQLVTDYISGMTDRFAVRLYKQLTGTSL